jgi:SAM-dependent methyltransferase
MGSTFPPLSPSLIARPQERENLRAQFDSAAELYDRARPGYPVPVFEALAAFGDLRPGSRVLELGPGTGQATRPLAERGYEVVAVELGAQLAELARRNLAAFPTVSVVNADFERWPLPPEPFDLFLAATAFHWLDPATRVGRVAAALRPNGTLATISTHHIAGGNEAFFVDTQTCYERWDPDTPPGLRLSHAVDIAYDVSDLTGSVEFAPPRFYRYEWEQAYSAAEYRTLLLTYSGHRALSDERREALLVCITELIDGHYGGRIVKRYMTELRLARKSR